MLLIYRASAGSGKTYQLTKDYIHLLFRSKTENGHKHILAVTFTNKATDEMKSRILNDLYAIAQGQKPDLRAGLMEEFKLTEEAVNLRAQKILISILHDFSSFSISTIDRFFQQVIRSFAREIGVHGGYNLELDSDTTLQQSVDNLFLGLSNPDNKQLLNWLTQFAEDRIEHSENWNPRRSIEMLGREIFKENYQHKAEETNTKLHNREFLTSYKAKLRKIITDFEGKIKTTATESLKIIGDHGLTPESFKGGTRSSMKNLLKILEGKYEVTDTFIAMSEACENCYAKSTPKDIQQTITSIYDSGLQAKLQMIVECVKNDMLYFNSSAIILKNINTLGILTDLASQIKNLTEEQNSMLITDTNMLLNKIIDNSETPFVYEKTGININHFMIDEFQDTSTLQWKNFYPLVSNSLSSGKFNMVVGDVKQSIYRWRNSDWNLLDRQILDDFSIDQYKTVDLDTNWRSDKNVVLFNNEFFRQAAEVLQIKLNANLLPVLTTYPELNRLNASITHAYNELKQKITAKPNEGRVDIRFIDRNETDETWQDETLKQLPALLEELQNRGYKPGDVGILVKKNDHATQIIQTLLRFKSSPEAKPGFSYDIIGNEGLPVESSPSVRFLLGLLNLFIHSDDEVHQTIVNYEYARFCLKLSEDEALKTSFSKRKNEQQISAIFTDYENEELQKLRNSSIFNIVEQIITLFNIGSWLNEAIFIQAFQDVVYKFNSGRTSDVNSFMKWWTKNGERQWVVSPDNQMAFRIMTIHKSKGLDFKVVVIPFCEWEIDKKSNYFINNILWCKPTEAPFNDIPLIPVEYSSVLGKSIFAENYFDEQMHQYIDNLNVAYVAFTRARNELICFTPRPKKVPENVEKITSLSDLLFYVFNGQTDDKAEISLHDAFDEENGILELGNPIQYSYDEVKKVELNEKISNYPSVSSASRLRIKHISADYWAADQELTENKLNYGIIMHDILMKMQSKSDQNNAVLEMINEGRINESDRIIIESEMDKFWALPLVDKWFQEDQTVLNEATILTPSGEMYRPDRVTIKGNNAIIVDYKFGDAEQKSYINQVKTYGQLISDMGYDVKSYLCYVTLGKVIEVQN